MTNLEKVLHAANTTKKLIFETVSTLGTRRQGRYQHEISLLCASDRRKYQLEIHEFWLGGLTYDHHCLLQVDLITKFVRFLCEHDGHLRIFDNFVQIFSTRDLPLNQPLSTETTEILLQKLQEFLEDIRQSTADKLPHPPPAAGRVRRGELDLALLQTL